MLHRHRIVHGHGSQVSIRPAVCLSRRDGGYDKSCPDDQYCELFGILCSQPPTVRCPSPASLCDYAQKGGVGICRMKPQDFQCVPGVQPVCGCDGVTYPSPCARIAANVFLAHTGSCSLDGGTDILDARGQ